MEDLGWGSYKVEILPGYLGLAASHEIWSEPAGT